MKKILILVLLSHCNIAMSQVLTSDSKGASTIVYKGTSAGINFSDQALSLTINQYNNYIDNSDPFKKLRYLWGLSINAKNNEGVADIFTSGNISPSSKLSSYSGLFMFLNNSDEKKIIKQIDNLNSIDLNEIYENFKKDVENTQNIPDTIIDKFNPYFLEFLQEINTSKGTETEKKITSLVEGYPELNGIFNRYKQDFLVYTKANENDIKLKNAFLDSLYSERQKHSSKYLILYSNYGLYSNSFKQFSKLDSQNVKKSFNKENFISPFINVGANYNTNGRWTFGGSIGYARANNFDSLTNKTFKYSTTLIDSTGAKLTSEKEIDAYEGSYVKFNRWNINTDVLYWAKVSDSISLVWDVVYIRYSYSDNQTASRTSLNIGTSIFFLKRNKGNWLGGIYLETNNLFDPSINEKNALKFGLIAKFTFKSILGSN